MDCKLVEEESLAFESSSENAAIEPSLKIETRELENNKNKIEVSHQILETKAASIAGISDIVTAIRCIDSSAFIRDSEIPSIYPFVPAPSTVRSLAFAYLCMKSGENLKNIKNFIRNQCKMLINSLREAEKDIKIYILILMVKSLHTGSQSFKSILLEDNAMRALVELYKDSHRQLRLLAAEVSGLLMRNFEEGQLKFLEFNGEKEILQLLKIEEADKDALLMLFEVLSDFLYVMFIQDVHGVFVPEHLRILLDVGLSEFIYALKVPDVNFS